MTLVMVLVLSLLFGVLAAARAGSGLDLAFRGFSYAAWAIPPFLLALVVQSVLIWLRYARRLPRLPRERLAGLVRVGLLHVLGPAAAHLPLRRRGDPLPRRPVARARGRLRRAAQPLSRARRSSSRSLRRTRRPRVRRGSRSGASSSATRCGTRSGRSRASLLLDFGAVLGAALAVDFVFRMEGRRPAVPRRDRGDREPERRRAEVPRSVCGPGAPERDRGHGRRRRRSWPSSRCCGSTRARGRRERGRGPFAPRRSLLAGRAAPLRAAPGRGRRRSPCCSRSSPSARSRTCSSARAATRSTSCT